MKEWGLFGVDTCNNDDGIRTNEKTQIRTAESDDVPSVNIRAKITEMRAAWGTAQSQNRSPSDNGSNSEPDADFLTFTPFTANDSSRRTVGDNRSRTASTTAGTELTAHETTQDTITKGSFDVFSDDPHTYTTNRVDRSKATCTSTSQQPTQQQQASYVSGRDNPSQKRKYSPMC
jgi:hypothetical protein